jgi:membrane protein DedA with SNARE-associated domain
MDFQSILENYGYIALFIGTFIEGEIVVIAGALLASLGYFSLPFVFLIAFIGTFAGDQFFFYLGRTKSARYLARHPHLREKVDYVHELLKNHRLKVLFGFRFLYGFRIPTLVALGTSDIPEKKFVSFNLVNSLLWTILFVSGGYFFGDLFTVLIDDIRKYEKPIFIVFAIIALIVWIISFLRHRHDYD